MRVEGLRGIPREKTRKTTHAEGAEIPHPEDKVNRQFAADAPNRLWVADLTNVRTHAGWCQHRGSTTRSSVTRRYGCTATGWPSRVSRS